MSTPAPSDRKLAARRNNERVRLLAATLNTIGLSVFGAAFLLPAINGVSRWAVGAWIPVAIALHVLAHLVYGLLRSED